MRSEVLTGQPKRGNAECQLSLAEEELTFGKDPTVSDYAWLNTFPSHTAGKFTPRLVSSSGAGAAKQVS